MPQQHLLPPGVPGRWLLGNLPEFRRDMLGFFTRCAREFGDVVQMRFGPRLVHLVSHPDFVEQVLVTEHRKFGKSYVFELLRPVLGQRATEQRRGILAPAAPFDSAGLQPQ